MTNIEAYKSRLTPVSAKIFEHFEKTGEDDMFFLGQIASGEVKNATLQDLIHRAQVFANPKFRGRVGSRKGFTSFGNISVVNGVNNGSVKGLINDGFTSFVVADKTIGLSDLRQTYASESSKSFHLINLTFDISAVEGRLNNIASEIQVPAKKGIFSKSKTVPFEITKKQSSNSVAVLMDEIYQVVEKRIGGEYGTELEKSTASIFATWLISRALDLSIYGEQDNKSEKMLDEAMKLQFYTHLNGCFNNGGCAISNIISNGAELAKTMIVEMGYEIKDVQEKLERLDMPLASEPTTLHEALFGKKHVVEAIESIVDERVICREPDSVSMLEDEKNETEMSIVHFDEKTTEPRNKSVSSAISPAIILDAPSVMKLSEKTDTNSSETSETRVELVEKLIEIDKSDSGRVVESGEVVHKEGNAVNHSTLIRSILGSIVKSLEVKRNKSINQTDKVKKIAPKTTAATRTNYLAGVIDGLNGCDAKHDRERAFAFGYEKGKLIRWGVIQEVDKIYSPDKKKLIMEVKGKGSAATKQLKEEVAQRMGCKGFGEFLNKIKISLSRHFELYVEEANKNKDEHLK